MRGSAHGITEQGVQYYIRQQKRFSRLLPDGTLVPAEVTGSHATVLGADIGLTQFDRVTFDLNSSGGIGSVYGVAVPEPSSALLLALGACLAFVRRKR